MGLSFRSSPGENTPERLRRDGTAQAAEDQEPAPTTLLGRIARKAEDDDRDLSPEFLGVNMGAFGQVINKVLFGAPREVEALRRPNPRSAPPTSARIIQTAVSLFDQRASPLLSNLQGHAFDVAFVAALEFSFRDIHGPLATLNARDTDRLAQLIIERAIATRRMRDSSPAARTLATYAVRMEVELARARHAAKVTPPPPPPAGAPQPAPTSIPAPRTPPPPASPQAVARPDYITRQIGAIRELAPKADATQQQREASAIAIQRLVESSTRAIMTNAPQLANEWVRQLRALRATASFIPVSYNDGWAISVRDGRVIGTTNAKVNFAPAVDGRHYRLGLRDVNDTRRRLPAQRSDLEYEFGTNTRWMDAGEYANTLIAQDRWLKDADWPAGKSPWDLAAVTAHFQTKLNKNMPMEQVYARWQQYLKVFYHHGESLSIQGSMRVLEMQNATNDRFENDVQGLVNDMLPARTGERLMDCEFFSAITNHVFGGLKNSRGQPRFNTHWVTMDTHTTALVVERGTGPRTWAYVNNDNVIAKGTTSSPERIENAIVERVAKVTRWGNPSVFAIADTYDDAQTATSTTLIGPRRNAYFFDGRGNMSRVTPQDERAYWIYATTREKRLSKHAEHGSFIGSWLGLRNNPVR